jgi:hypothetical protein
MASNLASLPPELSTPIFDQLYHEDYTTFRALRSTCRKCRALSELRFFHIVRLTGILNVEREFFERIRTVKDGVGFNVRCVELMPRAWSATARGLPAALHESLEYLPNLRDIMYVRIHQ